VFIKAGAGDTVGQGRCETGVRDIFFTESLTAPPNGLNEYLLYFLGKYFTLLMFLKSES